MKIRKKLLVSVVTLSVATGIPVAVSSPAHASVWGCKYTTKQWDPISRFSWAFAQCEGNTSYRVAAQCNTDRYPYTTTLYGPWVVGPIQGSEVASQVCTFGGSIGVDVR